MITTKPLVSVLTTAYNREKYIAESIESILASNNTNFELIVVDDCSTDRTVEIAKSYEAKDERIKVYVNEKNLGDYPNRNKAASYAKGKYIKYVDSDDKIYPHGLEVMVKSMEQFPEAGFGLSARPNGHEYFPICLSPHDAYWEHFNGYGHFDRAPGSAIILREAFEHVGGFSGRRMIGDNELWFKMARSFKMVKFQRDLLWNRSHSGQELNSDYAANYSILRKQVTDEALGHPDCPLSEKEIMKIRKILKRKKLKVKTTNFLSRISKNLPDN